MWLARSREAADTENLLLMMRLSGSSSLGMVAGLLALLRAAGTCRRRLRIRSAGFIEAVVHKYYIDELYAALFVKPLIDGSTRILWQGVDRKIIDAAVNDAGDGARHVSDEVRHMQSGNIRSYAGWIAAGSAVVIAFMIWMGVR